jgi:hypothetical protein
MSSALATRLTAALVLLGVGSLAVTCSLQNQEGPDVTCQDLGCGVINACANGIIAHCADGRTVVFHVCAPGDDGVCDEDWQIEGQYRCDEYDTLCEGCNPGGPGCAVGGGGSAGAGGAAAGAGGASGGSGGTSAGAGGA